MKINLKISSCLNWAITILWICFIVWLWCYSGIDRPKELNGIGDFLAGVFAPLAFFWLVRGFYQQGKGIEQNSVALNLQAQELQASTEALNLQVQEMKASVEQQKNITEFQRIEMEERHNAAFPILKLRASLNYQVSGDVEIIFDVKNTEDQLVKFLELRTNCLDHLNKTPLHHIDSMQRETVAIYDYFTEQEVILYQRGTPFSRHIRVDFQNIFGRKYGQTYILEISSSGADSVKLERTS